MFITFEGIEGSGKSTQIRRIAALVPNAVVTKEPGGTPTADRIRAILLESGSVVDPVAEVFLFAASRRQHVVEVIRPALERGEVVLCDRFTDATLAYQGFGRLQNLDRLRDLNDWATGSLQPDLTLLFDLPEEMRIARSDVGEGDLLPLRKQVENLERRLIRRALMQHKTTREAAKVLGLSQATLVQKMKRWEQG